MNYRIIPVMVMNVLWSLTPAAASAEDNIALYELTGSSGDTVTYERIWTGHIDNIEDEPLIPGDIILSPPPTGGGGGGNCIPTPTDPCEHPQAPIIGDGGGQAIRAIGNWEVIWFVNGGGVGGGEPGGGSPAPQDGTFDVMLVMEWPISFPEPALSLINWFDTIPSSPSGGSQQEMIGRPVSENGDNDGPCDASEFDSEVDNFLTPVQKQAIADFLNSPDAQELWDDSNFGPMQIQRREQGGFLDPNGTFIPFSNSLSGPCNVEFDNPDSLSADTILIHTHPWRNGERQGVATCTGSIYANDPGIGDGNALRSLNLEAGIVLDADGFIVFSDNFIKATSTPNEAHFQDGACGYER